MEENQQQGTVSPGLLWTFIIVLIAGAGYFGWYFWSQSKIVPIPVDTFVPVTRTASPTPSISSSISPSVSSSPISTADWKTYTNTKYGYTVKYPVTAKYLEISSTGTSGPDLGYAVNFTINGLPIRIEALKNDLNSKTLEKLIAGEGNVGVPIYTDKTNINNYKVISINGQRAFQYINALGDKKENGLLTVLLGTTYYYQIETSSGTFTSPQDLTVEQKDIYNQFVSTFQFTK